MDIREKVIIPDLPYIWFTNLTDDEVRKFHNLYEDQIRKPNQSNDKLGKGKITFHIDCRFNFFNFLDGFCFWTATDEKHHVLYRSNRDWELWVARQQEIQELREEQAVEKAIEIKLLENEDRHLTEKTIASIKAGAYDDAVACIDGRMNLRANSKGIEGIFFCLWFKRPLLPWLIFAEFPTSNYGIVFLRKYDFTPQGFSRFAYYFAANHRWQAGKCAEETKRIYEEGMNSFPNDAYLAAAACLFWRRMRNYHLAIQICLEAIEKGLKDGTKSSFEGRMKRLERERQQFEK